jgi:hypothetical protein
VYRSNVYLVLYPGADGIERAAGGAGMTSTGRTLAFIGTVAPRAGRLHGRGSENLFFLPNQQLGLQMLGGLCLESPSDGIYQWHICRSEVTSMVHAGTKEQQIMDFLHQRVFDPILQSPRASRKLKTGVTYTIMRMEKHDARGMVQYYWSAIIGTEWSKGFAALMKKEGFGRFEEALEQFRDRFDQKWLDNDVDGSNGRADRE